MKDTTIIEVQPDDDIRLTIPGNNRTCVYVSAYNGLLTITGGASIISSIEGIGMLEKIASHSDIQNQREKVLKFIEEGLDIYTSEAGSKIVYLDCIEGMIEELRSSKPEKLEFNDYRDMNNPNGHPDKLRSSKEEQG